jgi:hypothetical protein
MKPLVPACAVCCGPANACDCEVDTATATAPPKKRKSGPSGKTIPYAERKRREQEALAVRLDRNTAGALGMLLDPGQSRQEAIRRLIWGEYHRRWGDNAT